MTAGAPNGRFSIRGISIRLFLSCWLLYVLHFATNTVREIYPALALGDHLSFDVSEYLGMHPDIFSLPGRGAFINNNPGASILGALPYALARPISDRVVERVQRQRQARGGNDTATYDSPWPMAREFYRQARARGLDVKFGLAAAVMQAFCMAPLSALSAVVMFHILLSLTRSVRSALLLAALYAVATPVFYRTAQLNQNVLVGHCALFAFALLWRPGDPPLRPQRPRYLLAGLLAGWAVVLDYSGVVVVLGLGLYAVAHRSALPSYARSRADIVQYGVGVLLSAAILLGYQWSCFGSPFYPAQHYMPAATYTTAGYRGMDWPRLDLLWETAFDMRYGLFTSAPLLLLALYPPAWCAGRTRLLGRRETCCIAIFCGLFFLFCSANQFGRMQFNTGVRHVVPVSAFLFLVVAGVLLRMPAWTAICVGVTAAYWSWCLAMYRDVERGLGVLESITHITTEGPSLPWLTTLQRMGYVSPGSTQIPFVAGLAVTICALWILRRPRSARRDSVPVPLPSGHVADSGRDPSWHSR